MESKYTTSRGVSVAVLPIATLIEKQRASFLARAPQVPTYSVVTATGVTEKHEHDEVSINDAKTPEAERAAWAEYKHATAEHERKYQEAFIKLLLTRGVHVEMPAIEAWAKEQEWLGIDVPDNELERKFHYMWTEVVGNPLDDIAGISLAVGRISNVPEEAIAEAEATFQNRMGNGKEQTAA